MRLPIIPFVVAAIILGAVVYLFNTTGAERRILDAPRLTRLVDIEGIETEVAISPDGARYVVVADGDLWQVPAPDGKPVRMTQTPEAESAPAWSPDGKRVTFTRGTDTFVLSPDALTGSGEPFKADATGLSWSATGRLTYVRNRGLWLTDVAGKNDLQVIPTDENPNVTLHAPRFSPDSQQIGFIKSLLNISGQVWLIDVLNGAPRQLVADRPMEVPLDLGWIMDGKQLVYLTNRAGAYSLWHVNFEDNTIMPLTQPLVTMPLAQIGIGITKDRIILPRHFVDSNIALSDGTTVVQTDDIEFEPAVSNDGKLVAYTVVKENKSEVWTAAIDGSNSSFRAGGHEPRFTADGFHLVYTHSDLHGNHDVWQVDLRNGATDRITDADELDITPDASNDGRWITFASTRSIAPSVWVTPPSGGKRLRINSGGIGPRFSPDSRSILFWNMGSLWIMSADGTGLRPAAMDDTAMPNVGAWSGLTPIQVIGNQVRGPNGKVVFTSDRPLWPRFDVMDDGRLVIAPIDIRETQLWAVDLQFRNQ